MPIITNSNAPQVELPSTGAVEASPVVAPAVTAPAVASPVVEQTSQGTVEGTTAALDTGNVQTGGVGSADAASATTAAPDVSGVVSNAGDAGNVVADPSAGKAPEPELTKSEKLQKKIDSTRNQIAKLSAQLEQLEQQFRSADQLDAIKAGSVIVARVGRAETSKEVTASVVGVQTLDSGDRRFKIYFGEGFDADTVVIQESQIVDIKQV